MAGATKDEITRRIAAIGVIPVVRAESTHLARRAASAIRQGGIPVLEITMTVPGALDIIRELSLECGNEVLIGAGTVMDPDAARDCIAAGARFIVSPSLNLATIEFCKKEGVVLMPGALTPTEIVTAWTAGADFVKVFPAGTAGGPAYIRSLKAPLPEIKLVPTGGVTLANAASYIEAGAEAVGVGGELVNLQALREGKDEEITERARQLLESVAQARSMKKEARAQKQSGGSGGRA
ncbi:MAG TPA: bifunctional 4-hydroxy-2-oxoglutarate aldolase/2-dehydro-3-deoxy-phosphogluconate aldolase [Candidatus Acidoferrales bacterium]|nr:bifunctional 4-hydroxy-2-oxoglutarate aldolase/2-dehydro-3-deoxy-phosphogluconate aldolase [Candidatus Acidoferrales bacterium]